VEINPKYQYCIDVKQLEQRNCFQVNALTACEEFNVTFSLINSKTEENLYMISLPVKVF